MKALEEARTVLKRLSPEERQTVLEWLAEPLEVAPGIFRTPGVCGGEACVGAMRLPVWLLEEGRRQGANDQALLKAHPNLTREDLERAWAYVGANAAEIERLIKDNASI